MSNLFQQTLLSGKLKLIDVTFHFEAIAVLVKVTDIISLKTQTCKKVKEEYLDVAKDLLQEINIQISKDDERHLGAVIGSEDFKKQHIEQMIKEWSDELTLLTEISQPQAVYACTLVDTSIVSPNSSDRYLPWKTIFNRRYHTAPIYSSNNGW